MKFLSYLVLIAASVVGLQTSAQAQGRGELQFCANEGQFCQVSGDADVYYGIGRSFAVQYNVRGGIQCVNANFGDPAPGADKACYVDYTSRGRDRDRDRDRGDRDNGRRRGSWQYCARENQICRVPENTEVRYGVPGRWTSRNVRRGNVICSNNQFGDPAPGRDKTCEYFSRF